MEFGFLVALSIFCGSVSAQEFFDVNKVSLILGGIEELRERVVFGVVPAEEVDQIFKKVTRKGRRSESEDGPAISIEGVSDGEHIRVSVVQEAPAPALGDGTARGMDLVLRYSHILVERETAISDGAMKRVQGRVYRIYFGGFLGPIVKRDVKFTPFGNRMPLPGDGITILIGTDPQAIQEWKALVPRLMKLGRPISV